MFLKLERDATVTPAHFIRAWDRYAGSAAGTYKENVFSRREDPRKDGRTSSFGQEYRKNDPEGLMYDGVSVCCSPELWKGEGDEYFLCGELSEFFLDLAQQGQTLTEAQFDSLDECVGSKDVKGSKVLQPLTTPRNPLIPPNRHIDRPTKKPETLRDCQRERSTDKWWWFKPSELN